MPSKQDGRAVLRRRAASFEFITAERQRATLPDGRGSDWGGGVLGRRIQSDARWAAHWDDAFRAMRVGRRIGTTHSERCALAAAPPPRYHLGNAFEIASAGHGPGPSLSRANGTHAGI